MKESYHIILILAVLFYVYNFHYERVFDFIKDKLPSLSSDESSLLLVKESDVSLFLKYKNDVTKIVKHGKHAQTCTDSTGVRFIPDEYEYFYDPTLNIFGRYAFIDSSDKKMTTAKIIIKPNSQMKAGWLYWMHIYKWNEESQDLMLYSYKYHKFNDSSKTYDYTRQFIYTGKKQSIEILEKKYLDSFFHPLKDDLWTSIKTLHTQQDKYETWGLSPQINLLLYGPPGTGKSSFAYRLSMLLSRTLISVDLRCMKSVGAMHDFFSGNMNAHSKTIYILDEFDLCIAHFHERAQKHKYYESLFMNNALTSKSTEYKNKWNVSSKEDEEKNKKLKEELEYYREEMNNNTEIKLNDLLELFQGPIPKKGCIIIATTNKYEDIKNACPALVRPGRLTPVFFGNPTTKMIDEMSMYYFKKHIKLNKDYVASISSAEILNTITSIKCKYDSIETTTKSNSTDKDSKNNEAFKEFQTYIDKKINS